MPPHIEESPDELARRLKMPETVVDHILNEFTQISIKNQSKINSQQDDPNNDTEFKYIKSKENMKKLICHILGIALMMNRGEPLKASIMAQILKKEVSELKSYF